MTDNKARRLDNKARLMILASIVISFIIVTLVTWWGRKVTPLACWMCCITAFFMGDTTSDFLDERERLKKKKEEQNDSKRMGMVPSVGHPVWNAPGVLPEEVAICPAVMYSIGADHTHMCGLAPHLDLHQCECCGENW